MTAIPTPSNRHPVDQLANVRATIKTLEEREKELKAQISVMMGKADSLGGDEFIALQKLSTRKGAIDAALMEKAGLDPDRYRKPDTAVYSLVIEPRVQEAA
jgi:hypothetical protein